MSNTPPDDGTLKSPMYPLDLPADSDRTLSHLDAQRLRRPQKLDVRREPHQLRQERGPGAPRVFVLEKNRVLIGRAGHADISIPSHELSREHLLVYKKGDDEYSCRDLDSKNGLYLNGIKVASASLRNGDTIQLGDVVFLYSEAR